MIHTGQRKLFFYLPLVLIVGIFVGRYFYVVFKNQNDVKEAKIVLTKITSQLPLKGYIEQQSVRHQESEDFYGINRILLAEVANYYNSAISKEEFIDMYRTLHKDGWHREGDFEKDIAYLSSEWEGHRHKVCLENNLYALVQICLTHLPSLRDTDYLGGGGDDLNFSFDNSRKITAPYDLKVSAVSL